MESSIPNPVIKIECITCTNENCKRKNEAAEELLRLKGTNAKRHLKAANIALEDEINNLTRMLQILQARQTQIENKAGQNPCKGCDKSFCFQTYGIKCTAG